MKKVIIFIFMGITLYACNGSSNKNSQRNKETTSQDEGENTEKIQTPGGDPPAYDPNRGSGKFAHVDLGSGLNVSMATNGEKVYTAKCSACHKTTDEKLVGPGWKGVTSRYRPEWIMNFMTNTDEMLNKDPKAQKQLEICLVRMPNQMLTDDEARHLLEFMRKNDGVK